MLELKKKLLVYSACLYISCVAFGCLLSENKTMVIKFYADWNVRESIFSFSAFDDALKYLHKKLRLLLVVGYGKWCRSFTTPCTSQLPLTTTGKKKKMLLQQ